MIFNSLGSNYNWKKVLHALFTKNNDLYVKELSSYLDKQYQGKTYFTYKGRHALQLALKTAGLPKKSSVIINGFTCMVAYQSIINSGYNPIPLDIDPYILHFTAEDLINKVKKSPSVKAVVIQNTLGIPCKGDKIIKICKKYNLVLIEDLAHCAGSVYESGKKAGTIGDFTILSFSQDKILDAISGGALIIRNNKYKVGKQEYKTVPKSQQTKDRLYPFFTMLIRNLYVSVLGKVLHFLLKKANILSTPLWRKTDKIYSLSSWYCKLAYISANELQNDITHRRIIALSYLQSLPKEMLFISKNIVIKSSNIRFPIYVNKRDNLIQFLKTKRIYISDIWYESPIAPKHYWKKIKDKYSLPTSEKVSHSILNLPTHKGVSQEKALYISALIKQWQKSQLKK